MYVLTQLSRFLYLLYWLSLERAELHTVVYKQNDHFLYKNSIIFYCIPQHSDKFNKFIQTFNAEKLSGSSLEVLQCSGGVHLMKRGRRDEEFN